MGSGYPIFVGSGYPIFSYGFFFAALETFFLVIFEVT